MQNTLSLGPPLSPSIASQHRQYLLLAHQQKTSLIQRLQLQLAEVEAKLSRHPLPKSERKRLSKVRSKTNRSLQRFSNDITALETSLAELKIIMQVQTQQCHSDQSHRAGNQYRQWVWNGTSFVEQSVTNNSWEASFTTGHIGVYSPQWQGQSFSVSMVSPREYQFLQNSPTGFQYPSEQALYDALPEYVPTVDTHAESSGNIAYVNEAFPIDAQPISMPGFETFAWDHFSNSPNLWVNTIAKSNVSPFVSPRTIIRSNIPPPILTGREPDPASLRGDAPIFTPSLTWSCPVTPQFQQDNMENEPRKKEANRRYSAAAVDLIEYRLRHPSSRTKGKWSRYGRDVCKSPSAEHHNRLMAIWT